MWTRIEARARRVVNQAALLTKKVMHEKGDLYHAEAGKADELGGMVILKACDCRKKHRQEVFRENLLLYLLTSCYRGWDHSRIR